ncbi:hypothetical protein BC828DRAFT_404786 [Blastocladiella britannica]|nr:hypothetical protein BC828DRAFT_404786 [Blastocladiella britannica]
MGIRDNSSSAGHNAATSPLSPSSAPHEVVSLRAIDGKASIEHLISIHVQDLFDIASNPDVTAAEVLAGLRYLMVYRIRGGKMPSLELPIMKRLCESLLLNMTRRMPSASLLGKRLSVEANEAFCLFVEFAEEVEEFRVAVAAKPAAELRRYLRIDKRIGKYSGKETTILAIKFLNMAPSISPQFADWRDLVADDEVKDVEQVMTELGAEAAAAPVAPSKDRLFPPPDLYFDRTIKKVLYMFKTHPDDGLPARAIADLQEHYGRNELPPPPKPSVIKMLIGQVTDFMVLILIAVSILEFAMRDPDPAIVILIVVVLNVIIGFTQELQANRALEALSSLSVPRARVIRDGTVAEVEAGDLVPGDVVVLEEGDAVPADLRIIESAQLEVIEAVLTGEPLGVLKSPDAIRHSSRRMPLGDCKGNAFMATLVAKGRGKGVVVRVGESTEVGKIAAAITSQPHAPTPIQIKLDKLGKVLVVVAFLLCALVVVIGLAYSRPVLAMVKTGITLAVSVIPEGLVAVVTVTMALGVRRMAANNAIVRKLPSVETLGSVTTICSDKTGTLTEGKMGTQEAWTVDGTAYHIERPTEMDPAIGGLAHPGSTEIIAPEAIPALMRLTMLAASLCNNANVAPNTDADEAVRAKEPFRAVGDATEVAMVIASQKMRLDKRTFEASEGWRRVAENAFDSDRKVMSVVYEHQGNGFVLAKGAPENVLARCTGFVTAYHGETRFDARPLQVTPGGAAAPAVQLISDAAAHMASKGLRVLALAVRACTISPDFDSAAVECEWNFVGLLGLIDPPRAGVQSSVASCQRAGIKVIMITGDHIATASAIAKQLGILDPAVPSRSRAIRGAELDMLSDDQIAALRPFPSVFARVSPDNKLKIVLALKSAGHVVAMTGDGVNDAPAIKAADVGVAMGIAGTEITKQAADVILANDNFTTIVTAVAEGRRVFDNIFKFIVYLLSCNSAEIWIMLLCAVVNRDLPYTSIVILYANIIADVPPAMALGIEGPELDIMDRPPRDPGANVVDWLAATSIMVQSLSMSLITFGLYMIESPERATIGDRGEEAIIPDSLRMARAESFALLTTMQLFQGFISRSSTQSLFTIGLIGNRYMVGGVIFSFIMLLIGLYIPGFCEWLELLPPDGIIWAKVAGGLAVHIAVTEVLKFGLRKRMRSVNAAKAAARAAADGGVLPAAVQVEVQESTTATEGSPLVMPVATTTTAAAVPLPPSPAVSRPASPTNASSAAAALVAAIPGAAAAATLLSPGGGGKYQSLDGQDAEDDA